MIIVRRADISSTFFYENNDPYGYTNRTAGPNYIGYSGYMVFDRGRIASDGSIHAMVTSSCQEKQIRMIIVKTGCSAMFFELPLVYANRTSGPCYLKHNGQQDYDDQQGYSGYTIYGDGRFSIW